MVWARAIEGLGNLEIGSTDQVVLIDATNTSRQTWPMTIIPDSPFADTLLVRTEWYVFRAAYANLVVSPPSRIGPCHGLAKGKSFAKGFDDHHHHSSPTI